MRDPRMQYGVQIGEADDNKSEGTTIFNKHSCAILPFQVETNRQFVQRIVFSVALTYISWCNWS